MKISIIVPNYNHGKHVSKNINSVLMQTYQNWELIVIDDKSTDDSRDIIEAISKSDGRIVVVYSKDNVGALHTLNLGLSLSTGELIYASAADDYIYDNNFFKKAVDELKSADIGGFFGKTALFSSEDLKPINIIGKSPYPKITSGVAAKEIFQGTLSIPSTSFIWRKSAGQFFNYYNSNYGPYADMILNYQIAERYGLGYKDDIYGMMRFEEKSYGNSIGKEDFLNGNLNLLKELLSIKNFTAKDKKLAEKWITKIIDSRYNYKFEIKIMLLIRFLSYFLDSKKFNAIDKNLQELIIKLVHFITDTKNNNLLWQKKFLEVLNI